MNNTSTTNLTDNARRLEITILTSQSDAVIPTEEDILILANQLRKIPLYAVTDDELELVLRRLHEALRLDMGLGNKIVSDHEPWLQARKSKIEPFYWTRYQTDLRKQAWPPKVLNSLDKVTDDILDLCGDPGGDAGWPRRGLVMGDVQSGKTSNYTGLICKAADAGYRLIILLTGTLESLRRQTQERLDWGFVGLDSSGFLSPNKQRREIGVGMINGQRSAGVFTSTVADFRALTMSQLGFKLSSFNEPVLLVVKKNKRILENLALWLLTFNAGSSSQIDAPMLLIDDESDNASVNTNPKRVTAINAGIRGVLKLFPRSSYVGFTATPFANVFINPDSTDDMVGDDLFPRDFIYALDAPTNYFGARRIFGEDSAVDCLRPIEDAASIFRKGMKADETITGLPESLTEAVCCFVIANTVMDLRTGMPKHRSMLVNVSHFSQIQDQVRDMLDERVRVIQRDIRNNSSLPVDEAVKNGTLIRLKEVFDREYSELGVSWTDVQSALADAALPIEVRAVNQNAGPGSLDYSEYKQNGLRVIAVGGNSLSRGLTLEGLVVSYFYRSTQMYDALLQMGRWFGYRSGYEDIVRIWMTDGSMKWYAHISEATDELRSEVRHMQLSRLKPIDFGLRVRDSPESLAITARNKMRHSEQIVRNIAVSGEAVESTRLTSDEDIIRANFSAAQRLITALLKTKGKPTSAKKSGALWQKVPKELVVQVLRAYVSHPLNLKFQAKDLADFIEESHEEAIREWDVFIPEGDGQPFPISDGQLQVALRQRRLEIEKSRRALLVSGKKMRVGSRGDEKAGMSDSDIEAAEKDFREDPENVDKKNIPDKAYRLRRRCPLLVISFVDGETRGESGSEVFPYPVPEGTALVALGLSFPRLKTESRSVKYRINLVELRNMLASEQDEAEGDDEQDTEDAEAA
jgi:hypothetical protein